jgi:hypothetical protein
LCSPNTQIRGTAFEQPFLHHDTASSVQFFGGLEDGVDRASEVPCLGQIAGGAELHGRMTVMAARMHDPWSGRSMGQVGGLLDRQGVDICSQTYRPAGLPPADHTHDARASEAGDDLIDTELVQLRLDHRARAMLFERQFRMLVQIPPPGGHVLVKSGDSIVDGHEASL